MMEKSCYQISKLYVKDVLSYIALKLKNWMCVYDPFLQIRSHLEKHFELDLISWLSQYVASYL